MPMKAKPAKKAAPKINPRIAAMNAAKAAKRAQAARTTAQEEVGPNYGGDYGDASTPIERRRTGTQPNNRAKSAVERAEARMQAQGRRSVAQSPGMDVAFNADEALEDFYNDIPGEAGTVEGEDDDYTVEEYPSDDDLLEAQQKLSTLSAKRKQQGNTLPRGARMAPIGRGEQPRGVRRQPMRNEYGRVVARSRDGRLITRTSSIGGQDKFDVPINMIPDGWSYQWIAVSITGKPVNNTGMFANGWEPVPAKRHDGFFMATGADGPIVVDDQMLCERPIELTLEARAEEIAAAKNLLKTQNDQFKPHLPGARANRGTGLRVRRSLEQLPGDIGRPNLPIDAGF